MKHSRKNFKRWESQARQFFGDDFWEDILSVLPEEELTSDPTGAHPASHPSSKQPAQAATQRPAIDLFLTERQIIVHVELPGLSDLSAVDLYLQNGELVITGNLSRRYARSQTLQSERFVGDFKRVVALPEPVEEEDIQAQYKNGLLEITMPRLRKKRSEPKKKIRIDRDPNGT